MNSPRKGFGHTLALGFVGSAVACSVIAACSGGTTGNSSTSTDTSTSSSATSNPASTGSNTGTNTGSSAASSAAETGLPTGVDTGTDTGSSASSSAASSSGPTGTGTGTTTGPVADASTSTGDGSTGPSGEGGAAGCPAAAVFCDGFEGSTTLDSNWTPDAMNAAGATIKVVSTMAHSGTNSVEMTFLAGKNQTAFMDEKMGFPIATSMWGRVWLNVNTPNDPGHIVYIELSDGMMTMNHGVRPLNTSGNIETNVDPASASNNEASGTTAVALPKGAWTCFEWNVAVNGTKGTIELYMGGTAVAGSTASFTSQGDATVTGLTETRIGYENYNGASAASTIYVDDFAVGTTQIGCN